LSFLDQKKNSKRKLKVFPYQYLQWKNFEEKLKDFPDVVFTVGKKILFCFLFFAD